MRKGAYKQPSAVLAFLAFNLLVCTHVRAQQSVLPVGLEALEDDLFSFFRDDQSLAPTAIRLGFHLAGTYNASDGTGGTNGGSINFDDSGNNGLRPLTARLLQIHGNHPEISFPDLETAASVVAVRVLGGPIVEWCAGRAEASDFPPNVGLLPEAVVPNDPQRPHAATAQHIRDVFGRMGLTIQETVALIGAHTVGRMRVQNSGYQGTWVRSNMAFNNEFFQALRSRNWRQITVVNPEDGSSKFQYHEAPSTSPFNMLPSDITLLDGDSSESGFQHYVALYADNQATWQADFAAAYAKILRFGDWSCDASFDVPAPCTPLHVANVHPEPAFLRPLNASAADPMVLVSVKGELTVEVCPDDATGRRRSLLQMRPGQPQPQPGPRPGNGTADPRPGNGTSPRPGNGTEPRPGNGTEPRPGNGTEPRPGPGNGTRPEPPPSPASLLFSQRCSVDGVTSRDRIDLTGKVAFVAPEAGVVSAPSVRLRSVLGAGEAPYYDISVTCSVPLDVNGSVVTGTDTSAVVETATLSRVVRVRVLGNFTGAGAGVVAAVMEDAAVAAASSGDAAAIASAMAEDGTVTTTDASSTTTTTTDGAGNSGSGSGLKVAIAASVAGVGVAAMAAMAVLVQRRRLRSRASMERGAREGSDAIAKAGRAESPGALWSHPTSPNATVLGKPAAVAQGMV